MLDLTPFGFTPTESLVYEVLLTGGPGTGYAVARTAGLARANAYAALEGLVQKGAARADGTRPKRYRPEAPAAVIARISSRHGQALDKLSTDLASLAAPSTPTVVEVETPRAALQLLSHEVARARESVVLLAPADAFPLLAPVLRRAASAGVSLDLSAAGSASLDFAEVRSVAAEGAEWPGTPFIAVIDGRSALLAVRIGAEVRGTWSGSDVLVASARLAFRRLTGT